MCALGEPAGELLGAAKKKKKRKISLNLPRVAWVRVRKQEEKCLAPGGISLSFGGLSISLLFLFGFY